MPLTVNPIADTPTVTLPALQTTTTEGAALLWQGITVTAAPGDGDDPLSIFMNVAQGTLTLASTAGLTITSDGSNGTVLVSGSQQDLNAALASGVTYTPNSGYTGVDTLEVVGNATETNGNAASTQQQLVGLAINPADPIVVPHGGTTDIPGPTSSTVTFAGATGTLVLDASQSFTGQISGFGGQDAIDLTDISSGASSTLGYSPNADNTGGTLTVSGGVHTANIALIGSYMAASFAAASDGHGGTLVTDPPAANQPALLTSQHS
jgi:hypothetical protein